MIAEQTHPRLTDDELDEFEALAPRLMPELRHVPVYCVNTPHDYPQSENVAAFTPMHSMDWTLFDEVDRRCGWRGDGVVIVFNWSVEWHVQAAYFLHELAHNTRCRRTKFPRKFREAQLAMIAAVDSAVRCANRQTGRLGTRRTVFNSPAAACTSTTVRGSSASRPAPATWGSQVIGMTCRRTGSTCMPSAPNPAGCEAARWRISAALPRRRRFASSFTRTTSVGWRVATHQPRNRRPSMSALLEKLSQQEQSEHDETRAKYRTIVCRLARGDEDPSLELVTATLRALGKSSSDLARDVQHHQGRLLLQKRVADSEAEMATIPDIDRQIAEADDKLAAARQAHAAEVNPLHFQKSEIIGRSGLADAARRELRNTCGDEEALAAINAASRKLGQASAALTAQIEVVGSLRLRLQNERASPAPGSEKHFLREGEGLGGNPTVVKDLTAKVAEAEQRLAELENEVAAAKAAESAAFDALVTA